MRFSLTTKWIGLKIRLILAVLIMAIGFYAGFAQERLTHAFWPGTSALGGILFFLSLGLLIGLIIPGLCRSYSPPIVRFALAERQWHPISIARVVLCVQAIFILVSVFAGAALINIISQGVYLLPQRLILTPWTLQLITFLLSGFCVGWIGTLLGLTIDLAFRIFIYLEFSGQVQSDQPQFRKVLSGVVRWIVLALGIGWSAGYSLTSHFPDRIAGLILIPVICCLLAILVTLTESAAEQNYSSRLNNQSPTLDKLTPEIASKTIPLGSFVVFTLGFLFAWTIIHWSFIAMNWFDSNAIQGFGEIKPALILLAILSAAAGIELGCRFSIKPVEGYLTLADHQGLILCFWGLSQIFSAAIINFVMTDHRSLTIPPVVIFSLAITALFVLWGICLGLVLPILTIGRPDRFDVWMELAGKIGLGTLLVGPVYLAWESSSLGNLLAIALGALLAIAVGGRLFIYDNPNTQASKRFSTTGRYIHASCILMLYLGLIYIMIAIPRLKTTWLKPIASSQTFLCEGRAGIACLITNADQQIRWTNRITFPERTDPIFRTQIRQIVDQILTLRTRELHANVKSKQELKHLLFNMPYQPNITGRQIDLDHAIRKAEYKLLGMDITNSFSQIEDISSLFVSQRPFHLIIVMLPEPWENSINLPDATTLIKRIYGLSLDTDAVWFIAFDSRPAHFVPLERKLKQYIGSDLNLKTVFRPPWQIISSSPLIHNLESSEKTPAAALNP